MSFFKRLFGLQGSVGTAAAEAAGKHIEHKGYLIRATPRRVAGQFQVAGTIAKEVDGVMREHVFVRADTFADLDTAVEITLNKAKMTVEQQGEHIFG